MPSPDLRSVDLQIDGFGGRVTQFDPQKLPAGASPFNQDVVFSNTGGVGTRPGMQSVYAAFAANPTVNYIRTFIDSLENIRQLLLDGGGTLRQDFPTGQLTTIGAVVAGSFAQSDTYAGREWLAIGDGQFGIDIPRQWDGTNFDRVSQCGPGAAPSAADGAAGNISAGLHQVSLCFVTREGYITAPAPPTSWTAGGSKKVNLTNIPTGPPNITSRIVIFTPVIVSPATSGPFFYFSQQLTAGSATFPTMIIPDNTTTSATFDFLDAVLQAATAATVLFNQLELGECSSSISYSERVFWSGERNKVHSAGGGGGFNNLTFDGGFGTAGGAPAQANAGPNIATAAVDQPQLGGRGWSNLPGIQGNNPGSPAQAILIPANDGQSDFLVATGFDFAIPSNATIVGVVVKVNAKGSANALLTDDGVFLVKANVIVGQDHSNGVLLTAGFTTQTYGSSSDLWGTSLSPADINAAGFGATYAMLNTDAASARTGSATNMTIQVFYTTPAMGGTVGPWGWTQGANYAGGASALSLGLPAYWGDAFAITGDGATAIRGQITQPAVLDYLNVQILSVQIPYRVRARVAAAGGLVQGTLHINLQSTTGGFTTPGLAIQASRLTGQYVEFDALLTTALTTIPSDMVLQVYADGTPTNGGTFLVDCIEVYPATQPLNRTILRASYAGNPEGFDVLTGFLVVGKDNGQAIRATARLLDNKLYIIKERSMYVTNDDNQNEPSLWVVSTVSDKVGTPSVHGVGVGEDWLVIAGHDGLYLFSGADPVKISQEIQPDWDTINWNAGQNLWVLVDTQHKRIHVGAPTGNSTVPNTEFVMDYSQLNDAADIADHPQAYYSIFAPGKVIAPGRARKWTVWNLSMNCAAITIRADGSYHLLRGNATGTGKVYDQVTNQFSDDGVAINSQYQTYFFPETEQEEQLQLGSHRKHFKFMTGYAWGSGVMSFTVTGPQGNRQLPLSPLILRSLDHWDFEKNVLWTGERASILFGTNFVGNWFQLTKLCPTIQRDIMTPVRGVA